MAKNDRIIFNIPNDVKEDFKKVCDDLNRSMTEVMLSLIIEYTYKNKKK